MLDSNLTGHIASAINDTINGTIAILMHDNLTNNSGEDEDDVEADSVVLLLKHKHLIVVCFAGIAMLALMIGNILHRKHIHFIPESLVVVFLGVGLGLVIRLIIHLDMTTGEFSLANDAIINKDLLNCIFLPIIIFEAGWALRNKEFISQLPYILIFAVLGTLVCMGVVALLMWATTSFHHISDLRLIFTFAILIAAVDPVATLSTYAHLNVDPLLNILVMGEAIINDAVAITLFEVLNDVHFDVSHGIPHLVLHIIGKACWIFGGSFGIGVIGGIILSWFVKLTGMRHAPPLGILYVLASVYFLFHLSAFFELSGIITVLFSGMVMSAYVPSHLSIEGSLLCSFLLKQMASLADMAVFLFVGIAIAFSSGGGILLGLLVIVFCLLGRALATWPLAFVCNLVKAQVGKGLPREKRLMISPKHMFMIWHAGLRGGIALVLCLDLNHVEDHVKVRLIEATTFLICIFLLVFGGTTEMCLKALGIPVGNPPPMFLHGTCLTRGLYSIQRKFFKPMLKSGGQDVHMHGSILKHLLKEAATKDEIRRVQDRNRELNEQPDLRHMYFGEQDPAHVDHGWTQGGADESRWEAYFREIERDGGVSSEEDSQMSD